MWLNGLGGFSFILEFSSTGNVIDARFSFWLFAAIFGARVLRRRTILMFGCEHDIAIGVDKQ
jgi:hypothetical protein